MKKINAHTAVKLQKEFRIGYARASRIVDIVVEDYNRLLAEGLEDIRLNIQHGQHDESWDKGVDFLFDAIKKKLL